MRRAPEPLDAEIEYRAPAFSDFVMVVRNGVMRWVLSEKGWVHASAVVPPLPSASAGK